MSERDRQSIREHYHVERRRKAVEIGRSAADYWKDVESNPPSGQERTTEDLAAEMFGTMSFNIKRDERLAAHKAFESTMEEYSLTPRELEIILWGDVFFDKIQNVLVEALGVDEKEVTFEATLLDDLGAEPIDFLDIYFRLDEAFGINIPRDALFPEDVLRSYDFSENPLAEKFARQLTVGDLCDVIRSLRR